MYVSVVMYDVMLAELWNSGKMSGGRLGFGYQLDLINSDFNPAHQSVKHHYFQIFGCHKSVSCSVAHCVPVRTSSRYSTLP